ncbi:MAG: CoA pyrophosphatase [Burkholderiaceae bacterium]
MPAVSDLCCDADLRAQIAARLAAFEVRGIREHAQHHAAVAVAIAEEGTGADLDGLPRPAGWSERAALILTRRAAHLRSHAGQWALPGGRIDEGETPEIAALRELAEEVGLALGPDAVLGRLDDYSTRSGFVITPVVVWGGAARALLPNPGEVASIHRIPAQEFLRADAPLLDAGDPLRADAPPVLRMPVGNSWIAAPTAAVLYQFRELCLLGRATRVAHFDQPRFAWN